MKKVSRRATKLEMVLRDKPEITVGLDLGDRFTRYFILSAEGEVIEEGRMASNEAAFRRHFEAEPRLRMALECGSADRSPR